MSEDNGNGKLKQNEKQENPELSPIEMRIIVEPNKSMVIFFPFLMDKIATYGFLKLAEKTLDEHYAKQKSLIQPVKVHPVMDFAKKIFHR